MNKNWDKKNHFLTTMISIKRFLGHQSYVLLCTETTVSNPPVVLPKSSIVH